MKLSIVFAFVLVLCVAYSQVESCNQRPRNQVCNAPKNTGRGGRGCDSREMWYYGGGECKKMKYKGCGGNGNRYCSLNECKNKCGRRG